MYFCSRFCPLYVLSAPDGSFVPAAVAVAAHPAPPPRLRLNHHMQSMSKNQYQGGHIQKMFRQLAVAAHSAPPKSS